jgi:hypothetical protein
MVARVGSTRLGANHRMSRGRRGVMLRYAIRDARQDKDQQLREDATRWLWWWAPAIAEKAGVQINVADQQLAVAVNG